MMDLIAVGRFAGALGVVLGLIALCAYAARRFNLVPATGAGRKRSRLALLEVLPLDGKRRLVLVRRDGMEHLLLIGPGSDVVVEPSILVQREAALTHEDPAAQVVP